MKEQALSALVKVIQTNDFRLYLQAELQARCQKNEKYSLRSFARALKVSPSALSAMLSNKRPITPSMQRRIALALGFGPSEIEKFEISHEKTRQSVRLRPEFRNFQRLSFDHYALIANWYHYAILELLKLKNFKGHTKWIAQALNITPSEVKFAVERLQRLSLLEITPENKWVDKSVHGNATNISGDLTSTAARTLQRQILEKSVKALDEVPVEVRSHTSMTLALNIADLPEAKRFIKEFRRKFTQKMEANQEPNQVYHLSVSLYPVTQF